MFSYRSYVEGVEVDGHPIQMFGNNLTTICTWMDQMHAKYPHNDVCLVQVVETEIRVLKGTAKVLRCRHGHRELDRANHCTTCGEQGI